MKNKITSFDALINYKRVLKSEISEQEREIKNNNLVKISSYLFNGESRKTPLFESISSINLKDILSGPLANMLSAFLMSNKRARKYFISFTIAKEMVPFILDKIKSIVDQNDLDPKNNN